MNPQLQSLLSSIGVMIGTSVAAWAVSQGVIPEADKSNFSNDVVLVLSGAVTAALAYWKQHQHTPSALTLAVNSKAVPGVKVVPENSPSPAVNLNANGVIVPAAPLPSVTKPAGMAALILGAILTLGLLLASHGPASAAQCVPYPQCMGGYKTGAAGTQSGGLLGPGSITVADLQNALADANAQIVTLPVCSATLPLGSACEPVPYNATVTGGDTRHGNCWAALIDFDNAFQAQNILPEKPGLALLQQKIFDNQHLTAKNLIPDYVAHACVDTFNDAGKNLADIIGALGLKAIKIP